MPCHFYILFSETKNRFYIGATCDHLDQRVRRHNANHKKGFTGHQNDWMIVYSEAFPSKQQAFDREREVKGWKSRKKIIDLISSQN
ncbi:GIY-YIG nuclease family protein [Cyclobacterium sp.]|uniref:GIY-YIG nuclease family protein n=1 Tax=Cyclobacterium sp. TaxID=1966343 RepID=UPI0019AA5C55|nr:GIY-YIG nuclease family protein [Cyclobacterium sp.]MBD3628710.1 GIY-YIG nuclease family protein [Cyclobacterium sp.]